MPKDIKVATTVQHGKESTVHWWNETPWRMVPVSYTHLTLPTILLV